MDNLCSLGLNDFKKQDPLKRLTANGANVIRASGARETVAFTTDPVAEYPAAWAFLEECEGDAQARLKLHTVFKSTGEAAKGFLLALEFTEKIYK